MKKNAVFAENRIGLYRSAASSIDLFVKGKKGLYRKAEYAAFKNKKNLNLKIVDISHKINILLKFLLYYGSVDWKFMMLDKLIQTIPEEQGRELQSRIYITNGTRNIFIINVLKEI